MGHEKVLLTIYAFIKKKGEKMKEKIWMRTVFQAYGTIDRVLNALDKQVLKQSLSSSETFGFSDTLMVMDGVLEKIHRKRKLCVLKYLTEQSVKNIKKGRAKILVLKFFDRLSEEEITRITGLSERTIHRKISEGLAECYLFFKLNGCDVNALDKCFSTEKFLMGIFDQVASKQKNVSKNFAKTKQKDDIKLSADSMFNGCFF